MEFRVKDIPGCEDVLDIYVVDTEGNVFNERKGFYMKPCEKENGYLQYKLKIEGIRKWKHMYAHRLVAIAFLDNPKELPMVNHKDENKQNNKLDNLEWCDGKYNANYGTVRERLKKSLNKNPINVYNLNGELISEGLSMIDCARKHLGHKETRIKNRYTRGFIFTEGYKTPKELNDIISKAKVKPVELLNVKTGKKEIFLTGKDLFRYLDCKVNVVNAIQKDWLVYGKYKIKLYKIPDHKETQ